jgi:hypothetical protein
MKSILFIITLFVTNFVNSQVIRVKVYEVLEHYEYDTSGVVGAVNTMSGTPEIITVDCEYIFDFNIKQVRYYVKGVLKDEIEFVFENVNSVSIITLTSPNDDTGFVLNADIVNESFDHFTVYSDSYRIFKAKKFYFVKSL